MFHYRAANKTIDYTTRKYDQMVGYDYIRGLNKVLRCTDKTLCIQTNKHEEAVNTPYSKSCSQ